MNKYSLIVGVLLFPSISLAAVVGQSQVTIPPIDVERCNDPIYFGVYEAEADKVIEAKFDESLDAIGADKRGSNDKVADKATADAAAFLQATVDKCKNYVETCSGKNIFNVNSQLFIENVDTCKRNGSKNYQYALASSRANFIQNRQTLAEMTIEENAKSMMARMRDILQPLELQVMAKLEQLESQITGLIKNSEAVPGSQLQS